MKVLSFGLIPFSPIGWQDVEGGKRDTALTFWLLLGQAKSNIEAYQFSVAFIYKNSFTLNTLRKIRTE